jgi:hypothetical protein
MTHFVEFVTPAIQLPKPINMFFRYFTLRYLNLAKDMNAAWDLILFYKVKLEMKKKLLLC